MTGELMAWVLVFAAFIVAAGVAWAMLEMALEFKGRAAKERTLRRIQIKLAAHPFNGSLSESCTFRAFSGAMLTDDLAEAERILDQRTEFH